LKLSQQQNSVKCCCWWLGSTQPPTTPWKWGPGHSQKRRKTFTFWRGYVPENIALKRGICWALICLVFSLKIIKLVKWDESKSFPNALREYMEGKRLADGDFWIPSWLIEWHRWGQHFLTYWIAVCFFNYILLWFDQL
jgi:hypothetical protein